MIVCVLVSFMTAAISAALGFSSYVNLGDGLRSTLLAVAAIAATIAVGSLEAFEAQGPAKKDEH